MAPVASLTLTQCRRNESAFLLLPSFSCRYLQASSWLPLMTDGIIVWMNESEKKKLISVGEPDGGICLYARKTHASTASKDVILWVILSETASIVNAMLLRSTASATGINSSRTKKPLSRW